MQWSPPAASWALVTLKGYQMMRSPKIAGITGRLVVVSLWFSEDVFRCSAGHWLEQMWFWTLVSLQAISRGVPINSRFWLKATSHEKTPKCVSAHLVLVRHLWYPTPGHLHYLINLFPKWLPLYWLNSQVNVCAAVTWVSECYSKAGPLVLVLKNLYLKTEICEVLSSLALAL